MLSNATLTPSISLRISLVTLALHIVVHDNTYGIVLHSLLGYACKRKPRINRLYLLEDAVLLHTFNMFGTNYEN